MFGGDKKNDCPFWRGACKEHACRLYVQIQGTNPNTGEQLFGKWGCTFEFLPWLLIENSQMQRQTGAAVESFRNENATVNRVALDALESLIRVARLEACCDPRIKSGEPPKLIDGN